MSWSRHWRLETVSERSQWEEAECHAWWRASFQLLFWFPRDGRASVCSSSLQPLISSSTPPSHSELMSSSEPHLDLWPPLFTECLFHGLLSADTVSVLFIAVRHRKSSSCFSFWSLLHQAEDKTRRRVPWTHRSAPRLTHTRVHSNQTVHRAKCCRLTSVKLNMQSGLCGM